METQIILDAIKTAVVDIKSSLKNEIKEEIKVEIIEPFIAEMKSFNGVLIESLKSDFRTVSENLSQTNKKVDAISEQVGVLTVGQTRVDLTLKSIDSRMEKVEHGQVRLEQGQIRLENRMTKVEQGQDEMKIDISAIKSDVQHLVAVEARVGTLERKIA